MLAGMSGSLRDHPSEFIESRKAVEVMVQEMRVVLERKRLGQATEDSILSTPAVQPAATRSEVVEALDCNVAISMVGAARQPFYVLQMTRSDMNYDGVWDAWANK